MNNCYSRKPLRRRTFLKLLSSGISGVGLPLAAGTSLSGCTHKKFYSVSDNILLSGGSFNDGAALQNALIAINLTQREKRVINTPFLPHSIQINPNDKHSIYCFEKNGSNACEVDLLTQSVKRNLQSESGQLFSGHASFSTDGKKIICVENNAAQLGNITIRDTETFNIIEQLPTLGLAAHDCELNTENILTVSNTGKSESGFHRPSLVSIDLNTGKLLERVQLENETLNCGHFKISGNNDLVVASAPVDRNKKHSGGVSIRRQGKNIITMSEPDVVIKRMQGEALAIEINEKKAIVAVTHPEANLITFWSINDNKIIKAYGIENPRGLSQTLDGNDFIVSYGNKPAMANIAISDLTPIPESIVKPTLASGEHMINWSKTLWQIMPKRIYD